MAKRYSEKTFECEFNGEYYEFDCYTTDTRNGFCHTCVNRFMNISDTKASYYNRTWECFKYESVLRKAISKIADKEVREGLIAILVDKTYKEEHEKAEKTFKAFETAYNGLNEQSKKALAESNIEVHNTEEATALTGLMALMSLAQ